MHGSKRKKELGGTKVAEDGIAFILVGMMRHVKSLLKDRAIRLCMFPFSYVGNNDCGRLGFHERFVIVEYGR